MHPPRLTCLGGCFFFGLFKPPSCTGVTPPKKYFLTQKERTCHAVTLQAATSIQPYNHPLAPPCSHMHQGIQPDTPRHTTSYLTADSLLHHGMQPASPRQTACSSTVCSQLFRTIQPALSPRFPCDNSRRPYMFPITSAHVPNYVRTCLPEDRHVFPYCSFESSRLLRRFVS